MYQVYQSSVAHGTDSTQAATGYFHMAMVFCEEGRPDIATSLHDQVQSYCTHCGACDVCCVSYRWWSHGTLISLDWQRALNLNLVSSTCM